MKWRKMFCVAAALCLGAGLVACGGDDQASSDGSGGGGGGGGNGGSPDAQTVTIGMVTSLSGDLSIYGVPFRDAAELSVQEINDAGGIEVDGQTYMIDLRVVDDRSEQPAAVQAMTQLTTDDGAIAVWGPIGASGPAAATIAQQEGVLNFSSSSAVAGTAGPPDQPLVFTTIPSTEVRISSTVEAIKTFVPDVQRVALVAPNDQVGAENGPAFEGAFEAEGIDFTAALYPPGTTDLSSLLTTVAAEDPDVILSGFTAADNDIQTSQFEAAGISEDATVVLWPEGVARCEALVPGHPCIAQPIVGVDLTSPGASDDVQAFVDTFLDFTGESALPAGSNGIPWSYDFIKFLAVALVEAGTVTDTTAIADTLRDGGVTYEGLPGEMRYDEKNSVVFGLDVSYVGTDGQVQTDNFGI